MNSTKKTISHYLVERARYSPSECAVVYKKQNIVWSDMAAFSERIAHYLQKYGIKAGDRVGVWMPNRLSSLFAFLGILRVGAIEVAMSPGMRSDFILKAFTQAQISALICGQVSSEVLEKLQKNLVCLKCVISERDFSNILSANAKSPGFGSRPEEPAIIQYTSGSTGEPKGVVLTQENFAYAWQARSEILKLNESSKILDILSLAHSCGKSLLFDAIFSGATLVLAKGFVPPASFLKTLVENPPTIITGPPLLFRFLLKLQHDKRLRQALESSLRYLEIGMAPMPDRLICDLRKAFPWAAVVNRYGVTENAGAASLMCHYPGNEPKQVDSLGKGTSVTSLDLVGTNEPADRFASSGEIRIKGKNVMTGYWCEMLENRCVDYRERGFLTGDIAGKDENGFLYFLGRKDDMLKVAGEKVAPIQVENIIAEIPGIEEVSVFGIENSAGEVQITAVYYAPANVSEKEIAERCSMLPSYMIPRKLVSSPIPLPKTFSGKIAKKTLQQQEREKVKKS